MAILDVTGIGKHFVMHLRDGIRIPVIANLSFNVKRGECVALNGPSGAGKSSVLKMIFGTYAAENGVIHVEHGNDIVDIASADPMTMKQIRRNTIGYVSQFLRVVPRVSARDLVAEPLIATGWDSSVATQRAEVLLERLNIPKALWSLPPATFSGGEQQRINIARGFITEHPILLLDEPSASLDAQNRQVVIDLIRDKKQRGVGILGIFHDQEVRDAVANRLVDVAALSSKNQQPATAAA
ncbi:phosphonate C-P lyase system protein PhnL [Phyllobacterium sophorae]|uniref:Phosphonate C-P lyase system protein PhnL n=1 Tax=Phyllobacterium sophorae TaxID=1520277 RepID=A0A2P7B307_9HYPH|nr:phosphonate C-P lyase system protein PhnL [Phyllobacterium sophorae]PSH60867.1 phosphonate C-P lyase system protein PhnL [Phyllobacterium sophorae]